MIVFSIEQKLLSNFEAISILVFLHMKQKKMETEFTVTFQNPELIQDGWIPKISVLCDLFVSLIPPVTKIIISGKFLP